VSTQPKKIGKYQIIAEIGQGDTGVVYQAYDEFAKRDVAIKVFTTNRYEHDIEHANFDKLFAIATAISSKIYHPHIVSTYDALREDDLNYVVMELVQGHSLQKHVDMGNLLPMQHVIQYCFKCCLALNFANSEGIIHQDIKPSNIMFTKENDVKIIDFGTAVMTSLDDTQALHLLAYASPERLTGKALTFQADVYSLGVTMFKLLTGRLPFDADDSFSYTDKVLNDVPLNIRRLRPEIPEALANVVHKAIQKSPAKRYAAWIDMATDLAGCEMLVESEIKVIADSDKFYDLKKLSFFEDFSDVELWEVIRISEWAKFLTGRTLVKEGDFGASFFILVKGRVNVAKKNNIIATLDKGDCFGEMAYIDKTNAERSASVVSMMPVMLMKIKSEVLEQASAALQVRFNRAFLKLLVRRLAQANSELAAKAKN
jgi:eukaryotic-like serine/threonine-protein kinase